MYTLEKYMLVDFIKLDKLIDGVTKIYRDINQSTNSSRLIFQGII